MRDFRLQGEPLDQGHQDTSMTLPEDIYSQRILELAAAIPRDTDVATVRDVALISLAELFAGASERIQEVDPLLTLTGLRLIYERNRGG